MPFKLFFFSAFGFCATALFASQAPESLFFPHGRVFLGDTGAAVGVSPLSPQPYTFSKWVVFQNDAWKDFFPKQDDSFSFSLQGVPGVFPLRGDFPLPVDFFLEEWNLPSSAWWGAQAEAGHLQLRFPKKTFDHSQTSAGGVFLEDGPQRLFFSRNGEHAWTGFAADVLEDAPLQGAGAVHWMKESAFGDLFSGTFFGSRGRREEWALGAVEKTLSLPYFFDVFLRPWFQSAKQDGTAGRAYGGEGGVGWSLAEAFRLSAGGGWLQREWAREKTEERFLRTTARVDILGRGLLEGAWRWNFHPWASRHPHGYLGGFWRSPIAVFSVFHASGPLEGLFQAGAGCPWGGNHFYLGGFQARQGLEKHAGPWGAWRRFARPFARSWHRRLGLEMEIRYNTSRSKEWSFSGMGVYHWSPGGRITARLRRRPEETAWLFQASQQFAKNELWIGVGKIEEPGTRVSVGYRKEF